MLSKAIALAAEQFEGKYDKGGKPYILHCIHVMNAVRHLGEDHMIVAVLHDIVEDTDVLLTDLVFMGYNNDIICAIGCITHNEGVHYDEYIKCIKDNEIATAVKLADLKHNSDITRMKGLRSKDFERLEKYHRAFEFLRY